MFFQPIPDLSPVYSDMTSVKQVAINLHADQFASIQTNECPSVTQFQFWNKVDPFTFETLEIYSNTEILDPGYYISPKESILETSIAFYVFPANTLLHIGDSTEVIESVNCKGEFEFYAQHANDDRHP